MSAMASQITGVSIDYSTGCSAADQRKHQSSASLAFVHVISHPCWDWSCHVSAPPPPPPPPFPQQFGMHLFVTVTSHQLRSQCLRIKDNLVTVYLFEWILHITKMSLEGNGVWKCCQIDCLFNNFFMLTTNKASNLHIHAIRKRFMNSNSNLLT